MQKLRAISLFTGGAGGFDLACEWSGIEVVAQVEINAKRHVFLEKNFGSSKRYYDINQVKTSDLPNADFILGGDPCQPSSSAGQRRGMEDDRYKWPEMFRIIKGKRPAWVVNENVVGTISNDILDQKITDLESIGYSCQAYNIPAVSVGAFHKRARIWLVANAGRVDGKKLQATRQYAGEQKSVSFSENWSASRLVTLCDAYHRGCQKPEIINEFQREVWFRLHQREPLRPTFWTPKSPVCGVAHGIPGRVAQIESLGDAVVPKIPYLLLQLILEVEEQCR